MRRSQPVSAITLVLFGASLLPPTLASDDDCDPLYNYRFRITQSLKTFDTRRMSAWSGGGGPIWVLESDTGNPFAGRNFGSGDRKTIYGSRAYGSGYPEWSYPVSDASTIAGRGFPYGVWPIAWAGNYAGGGEYNSETSEIFRPGGRLVQVPLRTNQVHYPKLASVDEETYWLIGDRDSTLSMIQNMVDWCHAEPIWPELFVPTDDAIGVPGNTTGQGVRFHPGNVLQYYRSSSFAVAHPSYNNTYAHVPLNTSTVFTHDQSSPLTDVMISSDWLRCINETVANALPILDKPPKKPLPGGILAAILCSIFLGPCALGAIFVCVSALCGSVTDKVRQTRAAKQERLNRRLRKDEFEHYP